MEALDEKKWFVYLGDRHEGPFSIAEIQALMANGQVTSANYVWCEGMGDWQLMSDVAAFAAAAQPAYRQASGGGFADPSPSFAQPMEAEPEMPASVSPIEPMGVAEPAVAFPDSASPITQLEEPSMPLAMPTAEPALEAAPAAEPMGAFEPASASPIAAQEFSSTSNDTGRVSRLAVAQAEPVTLQQADSTLTPMSEEANPLGGHHEEDKPSRLAGIGHTLKRFIAPLIALAIIGGVAFAFTAGYFDTLMNQPAIRAFSRTMGDATRPYLMKASDKFPALAGIVSPIPHPDDLSEDDYNRLREAASKGASNGGPRVAMALSSDSAQGPAFYVAGNVPEGTHLEIHIFGIPDTLLSQLSFAGGDTLTITKRMGKSAALHAADGKPIPRGQYIALLTEAADDLPAGKAAMASVPGVRISDNVPADALPKDTKAYATASYFLGGAKNTEYDARLKEFHAKLAAHAADELKEVHQFTDVLQSQLDTTIRNFVAATRNPKGQPIVGKIPPAKLKNWDAFDKQWMQLSSSLGQSFAKWSQPMLDHEYFYGMLYQLTQQAGQAVDLVHKTQQSYFAPKADHAQLDAQLTQAGALAASTLANLRAKVEQAEKLPLTANGMPRRDGL